MHRLGPVNPKCMAMWPAEAFGISWGTMNGLTREGACILSGFSMYFRNWME